MEKTIKYSLEISTPATVGEQEDLIRQLQTLPRDEIEFIAITLGAGGSIELATPVLSFIQLLLECINVPIVPHVTGSHQTQAQVQELLRKLSGMGIQTVLAVRGDGEPNAFGHGDDLIRFIEKTGEFEVLGAAYPEGHPEDDNLQQTIQTVERKRLAGAKALMTQVVMDNHRLYQFQQALKTAQVSMPLIIGVMPYVQRERVIKMIQLTQVTPSPVVQGLLTQTDVNAFKSEGLALTIKQIVDLRKHGYSHIHLFCQNDIAVVSELFQGL
ncbi:methylenetetrahydrofolate reductase [Weissella viridescens]|uniref:methylenetetrahydrofolate reductase n=1 Tax=Weissella viridescens TaxID=1629 RepID=UPI00092FCC22|nr:methylenetetrahydrofolate reductase [Weissella viridescens]